LADPPPLARAEAAAANPTTQSSASTSLCSEVCSNRGYGLGNQPPLTHASTGVGPRSEVVSGDGYGPVSVPATVIRVVAPTGGFDWGDAGIGAGGALALAMIGFGGVLAATNRRRHTHHQPVSPNS
jgi:hypothetical protein